MSNTIVIIGPTGSGKTTLAQKLVEKGYERIPQYTTRPMRDGEVDGVDYHFVSQEHFKQLFARDFFAEVTAYEAKFGTCFYGSAVEDYQPDKKQVIILNPKGVLDLKNVSKFVVYLDLNETLLARRLSDRGDSIEEINRRLNDDRPHFKEFEQRVPINLHIKKAAPVQHLTRRIENKLRK